MLRLQLCELLLARGLRRCSGALAAVANTSCSSGAPYGAGEQQHGAIRAACSSAPAASPAGQDAGGAARELGLDGADLPQLREMMASAVPRESDLGVLLPPPKQRKLTYADIAGYQEVLQQLVEAPDTYAGDTPRAPALDAGQWVDTHFKQYGMGFEPRSGFYVWRAWAAAHLPPEQLETLLAMEQVMGDDTTRSALLKQAQHELARLWDWQHRRAALGLSPDLPPTAAAAVSSTDAAEAAGAVTHGAAAQRAAVAGSDDSAAGAAGDGQHEAANSSSSSSSSSSSGNEAAHHTHAADLAEKGMLEVLEGSGALGISSSEQAAAEAAAAAGVDGAAAASAADQFDDVLAGRQGGSGPAGITFSADDVAAAGASDSDNLREKLADRAAKLAAQPHIRRPTLAAVQKKLERGRLTAENGRYRNMEGVVLRQYRPVADDDDLFLPSVGFGSRQVSAVLADASATRPVDPDKVVAQAVALAEAARRASSSAAAAAGLDADTHADAGCGQGDWSALPLLDRTVLHTEQLRAEAARLAARPKRQQRWRLLPLQPYTFDLQSRPPTATLDRLTAYLEVRYADVLLRKDAAASLARRLAAARMAARPGGASELLESPPAALVAAATLSAAERDAIERQLDELLASGQYGRYREAVLQLYCDGLASWDELQACWAAAQAGQELADAAAAPVAIAGDRADLFAIVSGQKQLGGLRSNGSAAADRAAAKQLWEAAGKKLGGDWAAAAHAATASSSSDHSSSSGSSQAWWQQPVDYEQAERTWQQLLQLACMPDGPAFERVLLACSSDSSGVDEALQQQLAALQESLAQATGLPRAAAAGLAPDDFESLQQLCAAPPSLEQLLQQHWEQLSEQELGRKLRADKPTWQQLWPLLQRLTEQAQQQQQEEQGAVAAPAALDAAALFDRFVAESEVAPLMPPPYPGARKVLRWEQRIMLHAASGQTLLPAEVKVKLRVSAAELQQEAGLSTAALRHLLDVAGSRYDASNGMLSLACDRFPTREENRRWCLETLHRLLQEAQARYPSPRFVLGEAAAGVAAA